MYLVLSAVRPESFRAGLESDLELSHYDLPKHFKGFMPHAIKLSESFQQVETAPLPGRRKTAKASVVLVTASSHDGKLDKGKCQSSSRSQVQKPPVRLYDLHKVKSYIHYLRDCTFFP